MLGIVINYYLSPNWYFSLLKISTDEDTHHSWTICRNEGCWFFKRFTRKCWSWTSCQRSEILFLLLGKVSELNFYLYFSLSFVLSLSKEFWNVELAEMLGSAEQSPQVSRSLLGIWLDLNNAVVWMVSACPLISKSYSPFTKTLGIVPSAPITIGITITFMFHCFVCFFFSFLAKSTYLSVFCIFLKNFTLGFAHRLIFLSCFKMFIFLIQIISSVNLYFYNKL